MPQEQPRTTSITQGHSETRTRRSPTVSMRGPWAKVRTAGVLLAQQGSPLPLPLSGKSNRYSSTNGPRAIEAVLPHSPLRSRLVPARSRPLAPLHETPALPVAQAAPDHGGRQPRCVPGARPGGTQRPRSSYLQTRVAPHTPCVHVLRPPQLSAQTRGLRMQERARCSPSGACAAAMSASAFQLCAPSPSSCRDLLVATATKILFPSYVTV